MLLCLYAVPSTREVSLSKWGGMQCRSCPVEYSVLTGLLDEAVKSGT